MRFSPVTLALVACVALVACADFTRGEYWDVDDEGAGADDGAEPGQYSYTADVHALMDSGCERCHAPAGSAGNTDFIIVSGDLEASYASTLEFVDLDEPSASRLLSKTAGSGHGGATIFTANSAEYALILAWIKQGAPL